MAGKIPPGMSGEVPSGQEKPVGRRGHVPPTLTSLGSLEYWPKENSVPLACGPTPLLLFEIEE